MPDDHAETLIQKKDTFSNIIEQLTKHKIEYMAQATFHELDRDTKWKKASKEFIEEYIAKNNIPQSNIENNDTNEYAIVGEISQDILNKTEHIY